MRLSGLVAVMAVAAGLIPTFGLAQDGEPRRSEEQAEPYHKHHDTRHGHDHFYPDRGAIVRDLPKGTIGLNYAGISYRYNDGVWYEARGPAFMVVAPPIGLVVPSLPQFATALAARGGETFLYVNETYYKPRPDLGGYEVVNDPPGRLAALGSETLVAPPANAGPTVGEIDASPSPPARSALVAGAVPVAAAASATAPANGTGAVGGAPANATGTALPAASASGITGQAVPAVANAAGPGAVPAAANAAGPGVPSTNVASTTAPAVSAAVPISMAGAQQNTGVNPKAPKVFLYPRNGQTADQQARDRYDCYHFAVTQSGFDPMRSAGSNTESQADFERAQAACFDARGYASR